MSGELLEFVQSSVGPYLFDSLPEELGNLVTSEVNYLTLLLLIYPPGMSSGLFSHLARSTSRIVLRTGQILG